MSIRQILLNNASRKLSEQDIETVLSMADADIKYNRVRYNKLTVSVEAVNIAIRCLRAYERACV